MPAHEFVSIIFSFIGRAVPFLVFLAVAANIGKAVRKSSAGASQARSSDSAGSRGARRPAALKDMLSGVSGGEDLRSGMSASPGSRRKDGASQKSGTRMSDTFMKDDRQNDWLAKQLREEARILRRGDMMDLGASHDKNCAASELRRRSMYILGGEEKDGARDK